MEVCRKEDERPQVTILELSVPKVASFPVYSAQVTEYKPSIFLRTSQTKHVNHCRSVHSSQFLNWRYSMLKLFHPLMHRSILPIFGHNNSWNTLFAKLFSFSYFYCGCKCTGRSAGHSWDGAGSGGMDVLLPLKELYFFG